jgi:hypothetical protein
MYSTISDLYFYKLPKSSLDTIEENSSTDTIEEKKEVDSIVKTYNPKIWGPLFWKTLHISSVYYPINASRIVKERMKGRILSLPYELPCEECRSHCLSFIETKYKELDDIVSGREKLVQFYLDFHNAVNKRHGKPIWSIDKVYQVYLEGKGFES